MSHASPLGLPAPPATWTDRHAGQDSGKGQHRGSSLPHPTCHETGEVTSSLRGSLGLSWSVFSISPSPGQPATESLPCRLLQAGQEGPSTPRRVRGGCFRSTGLICKPPEGVMGLLWAQGQGKCAFFLGRFSELGGELCFLASQRPCLPSHSRILAPVLLIEPKVYQATEKVA